jgi:hypothetical protein
MKRFKTVTTALVLSCMAGISFAQPTIEEKNHDI